MLNSRHTRLITLAVVVLITFSASAAQRFGPVGDTSAKGSTKPVGMSGVNISSGEEPPPGSMLAPHCFSWKLGDRSDSGTTWVSSSNAYLYTGAGLQFTPNKHTAPGSFTAGPDLAGIIGVGFTNPAYIPRSVEVAYSFLPVSRSSSSTLQPPAATIGLTWFNEYGPGNTNPAFEDTVTVYPASGTLTYFGFVPPLNNNTRYLVYVKTGENGNGNSGNDRGFAAAGVICFNP